MPLATASASATRRRASSPSAIAIATDPVTGSAPRVVTTLLIATSVPSLRSCAIFIARWSPTVVVRVWKMCQYPKKTNKPMPPVMKSVVSSSPSLPGVSRFQAKTSGAFTRRASGSSGRSSGWPSIQRTALSRLDSTRSHLTAV